MNEIKTLLGNFELDLNEIRGSIPIEVKSIIDISEIDKRFSKIENNIIILHNLSEKLFTTIEAEIIKKRLQEFEKLLENKVNKEN